MIYECTNCRNCADFVSGYRVFCLADNERSEKVCEYYPVGDGDASYCASFDEDSPHWFSSKGLNEAEEFSEAKYGEVTYQGIREWCLKERRTDRDRG